MNRDPFYQASWDETDRLGCTKLIWQSPPDMPERNLRDVLRQELRCSGTVIRRLRQPGLLMVNGQPARVNDRMGPDSLLEIWMAEPEDSRLTPEPLPLSILYEDDHLIAIDKGDRIPVHPSAIHKSGTLANAVAWHLQHEDPTTRHTGAEREPYGNAGARDAGTQNGGARNGGARDLAAMHDGQGTRVTDETRQAALSRRVRPVTRLDRNTSGITLFAKTAHAQHELSRQAGNRLFEKTYLGITIGTWAEQSGTIRLPIRRKPGSIIERETHPDGDPSVTHFEVLGTVALPLLSDDPKVGPQDLCCTVAQDLCCTVPQQLSCTMPQDLRCTWLRFRLETGRTHQIRVHCAAVGHPMLGDTLYGGSAYPGLAGQALHCDRLAFLHPVTRQPLVIQSQREAPMFGLPFPDLATKD